MTERIDIRDEVFGICHKFNLDPENVATINLWPSRASVTVYLKNANGKKFILHSGTVATDVLEFPVTTA